MPIRFTCDGCGKIYAVPTAAAGKRAKCAACGNVITVPTPPPAMAIPDEPVQIPHSPADLKPKQTLPRVTAPTKSAIGDEHHSPGQFYPSWPVLIALLLLATAVSWWARPFPTVWYSALVLFPVLAIVFLVVGTIAIGTRVLPTPASGPLTLKVLPSLAIQIPLAVARPILQIAFRKPDRPDQTRDQSHRELSNLFFRSLAVALMSTAIVIIGYWSGDSPLNHRTTPNQNFQRPTQTARAVQPVTPGTVSVPADLPDIPAPSSARPRTAGAELTPARR